MIDMRPGKRRQRTKDKATIKALIAISASCIGLNYVLVFIGSGHPKWVEFGYSRLVYKGLSNVLSGISGIFPFSLDELFIAAEIITVTIWVGGALFNLLKRQWGKSGIMLMRSVTLLCINLLLFQMLWGLNNYRYTVEELFGFEVKAVTEEELEQVYSYLVLEANELRQTLDSDELTEEAIRLSAWIGYRELSKKYDFISGKQVFV